MEHPLAEQVRAADPDRYRAALTAPEPSRSRLMVLYAFAMEVARTPWRASEPHLGQIRLQWWIDAVEEIYGGAPPRKHEIVEPLASLVDAVGLPKPLVIELIETRMRDTDPSPMLGRAEFDRYVAGTSGALMRLAAQVAMGRGGAETDAVAAEVGYAHGVANLLRAIPALAARDRLMIPARRGETIDRQSVLRGETPEALRASVREIAREAFDRLVAARRLTPDRAARPALLAAWRTAPVLSVAQRVDLDAFRDFGDESPFRRDLSFLGARARGW